MEKVVKESSNSDLSFLFAPVTLYLLTKVAE